MSILAVQPSPANTTVETAAATGLSPLSSLPLSSLSSPLAEVIGGDLTVPLVPGGTARYVNSDYAASAPALRAVADRVAADGATGDGALPDWLASAAAGPAAACAG
jgi:hypothetical protein